MRMRVLDAASPGDLAGWIDLWRRWPEREVMAHPEYARLFARPCDRIICVAGEDSGGGILFPLIVRPIAAEPWARAGERRLDAITPYGYGGPFAWGTGLRADEPFWEAHEAWCRDERIVSTFARLSVFPEQLAPVPGRVEVRAPNVVVPLSGGADAIWRGYETRVRKWVGVAERAGLEVVRDDGGELLDSFVDVYSHTMQRNGADPWYFFPRAFFEAIVERLSGQFSFFHALRQGEVVSSDLVLCSERHVYYFLGGTLENAFPLGPSYLLKHRIASWASAAGKRSYVLGGGYSPNDTLLRYKRGFARAGEVPFRVASMIHDEGAVRELAEARAEHSARARATWTPRPGYFPPYRA